jgi:hypothetical protein
VTKLNLVLLAVCLLSLGCGSNALTRPVVLRLDTTEPGDGYRAALATVQEQGYPIVVEDQRHFYLQVRARPETMTRAAVGQSADDHGAIRYIGIQAMPGVVDIFLEGPDGRPLTPREAPGFGVQMKQLAHGIGGRAHPSNGASSSQPELPIMEPPLP